MAEHTISTKLALYVLEQWYGRPEEERVRFRSFCFQAGLYGDDFKYVNNIKRVADCHAEPMKYIQLQLSVIAEEAEETEETQQEQEQEQEETVEEEEETQDNEENVEEETQEKEQEQEANQLDNIERLDVVIVRQGFTNMLLILLILVTSPFLAYNVMHLYNTYFRQYDTIYLVLDAPDVIYL